jgi:Argininosuccinate lyase C-terminal
VALQVRGATGLLIGRLTGILAMQKTPSARTDNLLYTYGEVADALTTAIEIVELTTTVVSGLDVHEDRMLERARDEAAQATDVAELICLQCGLDYRSAYRIVGRTVAASVAGGDPVVHLSIEGLQAAAHELLGTELPLTAEQLERALDPQAAVRAREGIGGAAPGADGGDDPPLPRAFELGSGMGRAHSEAPCGGPAHAAFSDGRSRRRAARGPGGARARAVGRARWLAANTARQAPQIEDLTGLAPPQERVRRPSRRDPCRPPCRRFAWRREPLSCGVAPLPSLPTGFPAASSVDSTDARAAIRA